MITQDHGDNQNKNDNTTTSNGGNITVSGDISGSGCMVGSPADAVMVKLEQSIEQNPNNEYLKGLKELTEQLKKEYEKNNVPEWERTETNKSIQDLEKEVKDIKPETTVEDVKDEKQKEIKTKTIILITGIFDALPQASQTIANLTPFSSPINKFIKSGVQNLVDAYKNYMESQS